VKRTWPKFDDLEEANPEVYDAGMRGVHKALEDADARVDREDAQKLRIEAERAEEVRARNKESGTTLTNVFPLADSID
jgi:hypothetical protein